MALWTRKSFAFWLAATVIVAASMSFCHADTLDVAALKQDKRLEKPVSLSTGRMPLKAVLDQFAAQTGVALTIDARDPSSGYPLLVECSQVPVGKMMNALYGLFSVQGGEWTWEQAGQAGAYTYAFHETLRAKHRTDTYHRLTDKLLNNYLARLRQLAPMKMEERKAHRAELKKALYVDNDAQLNFFFESEGFWHQANFFLNALTPEQQESVLHGVSTPVLLHTLRPDVYDFYHRNYLLQNRGTRAADGTRRLVPEPESVSFYLSKPSRSQDDLAPKIYMSEANIALSWMGTGHLEFGVRDALKRAWMLEGDRMTDPASRTVVVETQDTEATRQDKDKDKAQEELIKRAMESVPQQRPHRAPGSRLRFCLEQVARGSSTPMLALLPGDDQSRYTPPIGRPVQEFLDRLEGNYKSYFYKWRDGLLLVNYPYWFTETVPVLSYTLLHSLHPDKRSHVPLTEWAALMRGISDDQAQWFAANNSISNLKQLRPCLLFAAEYPRILHPEGDSIDYETIQRLQSVSVLPFSASLSQQQTRVRVREEAANNLPQIASWLRLEAYNAERRKWERLNSIALPLYSDTPAQEPTNR